MRKFLILMAIGLLSFACSKDDKNEQNQNSISIENLKGIWTSVEVTRVGQTKKITDCEEVVIMSFGEKNMTVNGFKKNEKGECESRPDMAAREYTLENNNINLVEEKDGKKVISTSWQVLQLTKTTLKLNIQADDDNGFNVVTYLFERG